MNKGNLRVRPGVVLWWPPCWELRGTTHSRPPLTLTWSFGGGPVCSENTGSCPASLVPCQQDTYRGLTEGKATQLCLPWQVHERTGDRAGETATAKKQIITKEEQKHFRDVCYFPLPPILSHTHIPAPYISNYYYYYYCFQLS